MAGVKGAIDRRGEDEAALLLQAHECACPGRIVRRKAGPGDGDKPPAGTKPRERGGDMAMRGVGHGAVDMSDR